MIAKSQLEASPLHPPLPARDVANAEQLLEQAERCRRLARATNDQRTAAILETMARDYAAAAAGPTKQTP
jgi:hypothetical protein